MKHHLDIRRRRRSVRLKGYDYTQPGAYFITINTYRRECLFGEVLDGEMRLNDYGRIVERTWHDLPNHVGNIWLDAFIVMPNHVHGIIVITEHPIRTGERSGSQATRAPKRHGLPEIVRQFKTFSAIRINRQRGTPGVPVWHRNYYEYIISDADTCRRIGQYIRSNPARYRA